MRTEVHDLLAALPSTGIVQANRLGLVVTPQLEPEDWRRLVLHLARLTRTATGARQTLTAWLGDALAQGDFRYHRRIATCANEAGLEPGTLRNAKMVCSRIPLSCRHDALSWTHHCEVGLAFTDPPKIEHWLALAEHEKLSTAELRKRIRLHFASQRGIAGTKKTSASVDAFELMRGLRATSRMLDQRRKAWWSWSPAAAQMALQELRPIAEFIDGLRSRALAGASVPPRDPRVN
jgi:hypothetical protein